MNLAQLQNTVLDALEDIKGQQILVFDAQPLTGMFDRIIIVSGTSNRQTRALAKNLHDKVKQAGGGVYGTEGDEKSVRINGEGTCVNEYRVHVPAGFGDGCARPGMINPCPGQVRCV